MLSLMLMQTLYYDWNFYLDESDIRDCSPFMRGGSTNGNVGKQRPFGIAASAV